VRGITDLLQHDRARLRRHHPPHGAAGGQPHGRHHAGDHRGPEVYVERINITGNTRSEDRILRRELPFVEGDLFTLQKRSGPSSA